MCRWAPTLASDQWVVGSITRWSWNNVVLYEDAVSLGFVFEIDEIEELVCFINPAFVRVDY